MYDRYFWKTNIFLGDLPEALWLESYRSQFCRRTGRLLEMRNISQLVFRSSPAELRETFHFAMGWTKCVECVWPHPKPMYLWTMRLELTNNSVVLFSWQDQLHAGFAGLFPNGTGCTLHSADLVSWVVSPFSLPFNEF